MPPLLPIRVLPRRLFVHPRPDLLVAVDEEAVLVGEFGLHAVLEHPPPLELLQQLDRQGVVDVGDLDLRPMVVGHGRQRAFLDSDVGNVFAVSALHLLPVERRPRNLFPGLLRAEVDLHILPEHERGLDPDPVLTEEPVQCKRVPVFLVRSGIRAPLREAKRHHTVHVCRVDADAVVVDREREGLLGGVVSHVDLDHPGMPRLDQPNRLDGVLDQFLQSDDGGCAVFGSVDDIAHQLWLDRDLDTFLICRNHRDLGLMLQVRRALEQFE
mmetsp:Transcript_4718/g.11317  ORF Transcript_4718/g.11317 Transcript_4718/m.11317 type:complete len:269 (+) Transcript_4718:1302-2108(+)